MTIILINEFSNEIIKPSTPTPIHLRFLRTSLFDQMNAHIFAPLTFYYPKPNTPNTSIHETLDRLKRSLSTTLSIFYPLGGRVKGINHIDCNDEGVPYVEAKVLQRLEDVVHKSDISQLDKLLPPHGQEGYTRLILAIQVNVFACGGLAIGVKLNHVISDAFSLLMFVKTWASIASGKNHHQVQRPYFEIWKLFPPRPQPPSPHESDYIDSIYDIENRYLATNRSPLTKWFLFSEANLNSLRSKLSSYKNAIDYNNAAISPPSLAMVLSAFIWSRIKIGCHNNVQCNVSHPVNIRPSISSLDEDSYYFGNMVVTAIANPSLVNNEANKNSSENEEYLSLWCDFVTSSKLSIAKITSDGGSLIRDLKEGVEDLSYIKEHFKSKKKGEIVSIGFSNLRGLPVYEADFGWGKPVRVTPAAQLYKDVVILINSGPLSRDIVAYVSLSCEDMGKLERDGVFNAIVSKAPSFKSNL